MIASPQITSPAAGGTGWNAVPDMTRIRRTLILIAGITGVLALTGTAAWAIMQQQHSEPLVES